MLPPTFRENLRSHWLHRDALHVGLAAFAVTLVGVFRVWRGVASNPRGWLQFHGVVVLLGSVCMTMIIIFPRGIGFWEMSLFVVVSFWLAGVTAVMEEADR